MVIRLAAGDAVGEAADAALEDGAIGRAIELLGEAKSFYHEAQVCEEVREVSEGKQARCVYLGRLFAARFNRSPQGIEPSCGFALKAFDYFFCYTFPILEGTWYS